MRMPVDGCCGSWSAAIDTPHPTGTESAHQDPEPSAGDLTADGLRRPHGEWRASASPGGQIGLLVTLVAAVVFAVLLAALAGAISLALPRPALLLLVVLSGLATLVALYLLYGYYSIRYELSSHALGIRWAHRRESIDLADIDSLTPAPEAWRQQSGARPFWSGYYVGSREVPDGEGKGKGSVHVVATMPPRRQLLVTAGARRFAISPERPVLFMEEYARRREALGIAPGQGLEDLAEAGWTGSFPVAREAVSSGDGSAAAPEAAPQAPAPSSARGGLFNDHLALGLLGLAVLLNLVMVSYVLAEYHHLPASIALHWNVNGYPDVIGSPREIWTVPIITALVTLGNFVVGWSIAATDRFAARLLLGGSSLVQLVAWVGLLTLIR